MAIAARCETFVAINDSDDIARGRVCDPQLNESVVDVLEKVVRVIADVDCMNLQRRATQIICDAQPACCR